MYENAEYRTSIAENGMKKVKEIDSKFWNTRVFDIIEMNRKL